MNGKQASVLEKFSRKVTEWSGSSKAFLLCCVIIIVWACLGPVFNYCDSWQLVINTGTTIVTFLMVFLIQRAQNRDSAAIHLKLNELIAAIGLASNRLIDAENLTEEEIRILHKHYETLADRLQEENQLIHSHSHHGAQLRRKLKFKKE